LPQWYRGYCRFSNFNNLDAGGDPSARKIAQKNLEVGLTYRTSQRLLEKRRALMETLGELCGRRIKYRCASAAASDEESDK
jgi:hypothetical protein